MNRRVALLLVAAVTGLRLAFVGAERFDLAPDEAYYWEWSRRLDWAYYSKGPMVAWLIAASTSLGGDTPFFVRLPAILCAAATALLGGALARRISGSERAGLLFVCILLALPLYAAGWMLMTIEPPFVFFWTLALSGCWKATAEARTPDERRAGWATFAVALGLGLLSKYTMLLFLPCLALHLLATAKGRAALRSFEPWLATAVGLAFLAPVVAWNARHDWVTLRHVATDIGLVGEPSPRSAIVTFFEFLGSQLGVVSPLLFLALAIAVARSARLAVTEDAEAHRALVVWSAPVLAFFLLWSLHDKVEANWAAPAYVSAAIALAWWWSDGPSTRGRSVAIGLVLSSGALLVFLAHVPEALGVAGFPLPPRLDPTTRLEGWKELGAAVARVRDGLGADPLPLASGTRQVASELAFYVPGHPRVTNLDFGRPRNQYDLWGPAESLVGRDLLFVHEGEGAPPALADACARVHPLETMTALRGSTPVRRFTISRCEAYSGANPKHPLVY